MEAEKLNEKAIEKKLKTFNNSQESVNSVSLWIMHHRAQHRKIVDVWLKVMRKSEMKHKLTLFYLCNDVVQRAKREKALYYLSCYKDILREAVYIVSEHEAIKQKIMRILNIWQERKIYDAKFVKELKGIIENESGASSDKNSSANVTPSTPVTVAKAEKKAEKQERVETEQKVEEAKPMIKDTLKDMSEKEREEFSARIVAEFKTTKFIDSITMLRRLEGEIDLKRKQLTTLRIDATSLEAVKQLKDRSHGKEFCKQFEDSCIKIEDYVNTLEREIIQRKAVLAMCENSEIFYDEQFKEAKIVANAYKNFGARVNNMKKKVDDRKKTLPATPSPVPSPSADAPSPGNTPPLQDMDDNEQIDMELDEEQDTSKHNEPSPNTSGRIAYTAMVKSIDQPISSITDINMGQQGLPPKGSKAPAPVPAPVRAPEPVPAPVTNVYSPKPLEKPPTVYNPKPVEKPKMEQIAAKQNMEQISAGGNVLESRIASMLPNLAMGTSTLGSKFKPIPPAVSSTPPQSVLSYTAPQQAKSRMEDNSDERAATPVLDEQEEDEQEVEYQKEEKEKKERSPPRAYTPERSKPVTTSTATSLKTNPIDFLSQLLTKTTKSSSSSNFLHSLSLLTNTVKSQYQQRQQSSEASSVSEQMTSMAESSISTVVAPVSGNTSPVSVAPSPMEAPLTSSWSGWQMNASHPPLPPQPSPDQPPPPLPVPVAAPPPVPPVLQQQPPFPPPQIPPQPTSPLPTPPPLPFPNAANQNYPNMPEASQQMHPPPSSGFQPHGSETFNLVSAAGTYSVPGSQPYQVVSSPSVTTEFIDPSLPPPPPASQPFRPVVQQQFPASPEPLPPRPSMQGLGQRPSFPPPGESKPFNPATALQQLLFAYGGARNPPPPEPQQELRPFTQPPPPWDQQSQNPPPQQAPPPLQVSSHEQGQGFPQSARPWDQPPPGPPQETSPPPQSPFQPPKPYGQWEGTEPQTQGQPVPPGPIPVSNAGPPNLFQPQGPYGQWTQVEPQQESNNQPPQGHPAESVKSYSPWDQPNKLQGRWQQPDMELESPPPEPEISSVPSVQSLSTPGKSILRKRNSSLLREVTLVDDSTEENLSPENDLPVGEGLPIGMHSGERIPVGILKNTHFSHGIKKPPTDIIHTDHQTDVQSEFIAKLKRKSGSSNLVVPPVVSYSSPRHSYSHGRQHSNLTTIEPTPAHLLGNNNANNIPRSVHEDPNIHKIILEEVEEAQEDYDPDNASNYEDEDMRGNQEHEYRGEADTEQPDTEFQGETVSEPQNETGQFAHQEQRRGEQFDGPEHLRESIQYQSDGQFENQEHLGERISTIGILGDRESRSSNDMDLESLEENQPQEQVTPENHMIPVASENHMISVAPENPLIQVGPETRMIPVGPENHMIPVGPDNHMIQIGPETRMVQVGPDNQMIQVGPETHMIQVGPENHMIQVGPDTRMIQVGPETHMIQIGPEDHMIQVGPETRMIQVGHEPPPGHEPPVVMAEGQVPHIVQLMEAPPPIERLELVQEPEENWQEKHQIPENKHQKFQHNENFQRPNRPRFDHFRPRQPFRPYHRPFRERFRGPRPRNFNPRPFYRF